MPIQLPGTTSRPLLGTSSDSLVTSKHGSDENGITNDQTTLKSRRLEARKGSRKLLKQLGDFSPYQVYVYCLTLWPNVLAGIILIQNVFVLLEPNHRCLIPQCETSQSPSPTSWVKHILPIKEPSCSMFMPIMSNQTSNDTSFHHLKGQDDQCPLQVTHQTQRCVHGFVYNYSGLPMSAVSEWDLVCDRTHLYTISESTFFTGTVISSIISGYLADKFGRRSVYIWAPGLLTLSGLIVSYSETLGWFMVPGFIMSFSTYSLMNVTFIMGVEWVGSSWRLIIVNGYPVAFVMGEVILTIIFYSVDNWREGMIIVSTLCATCSFLWAMSPESVLWQLSHKKEVDAYENLETAIRWNTSHHPHSQGSDHVGSKPHDLPEDSVCLVQDDHIVCLQGETKEDLLPPQTQPPPGVIATTTESSSSSTSPDVLPGSLSTPKTGSGFPFIKKKRSKRVSIMDMFRNPMLFQWILFLCFITCSVNVLYYGVTLSSKEMMGDFDFYLGFLAIAVVEIPFVMILPFLMHRHGRRIILFSCLGLTGLFCALIYILPSNTPSSYLLMCVVASKGFVSMASSIMYLYAAEIFPTSTRTIGLGLATTAGSLGTVLAPMVTHVNAFGDKSASLVLLMVSFLSGLSVIILPETKGHNLPETLEDVIALKEPPLSPNKGSREGT